MTTNLLNYIVKDGNGKNFATYKIFEQDKDSALEIINNFCCYGEGLIPQPWFGNIKNPKILILGVNPSFTKEDQTDYENDKKDDNKDFSKFLKKNLDLSGRDDDINWLVDSDSNLAKWWKKFFGIDNNVKAKKIKEISANIGILNYYGYNATNISDDIKLKSHVYLLDNLKERFSNVEVIILLWKVKCYNMWESIIEYIGLKDKPVYYANVKNSRYPRFFDSQLFQNNNKSNYFEKIKNSINE